MKKGIVGSIPRSAKVNERDVGQWFSELEYGVDDIAVRSFGEVDVESSVQSLESSCVGGRAGGPDWESISSG
jgi:hypothetical protein